jgi:hypothetical protein
VMQSLTFDNIEVNLDLEDTLFAFPAK